MALCAHLSLFPPTLQMQHCLFIWISQNHTCVAIVFHFLIQYSHRNWPVKRVFLVSQRFSCFSLLLLIIVMLFQGMSLRPEGSNIEFVFCCTEMCRSTRAAAGSNANGLQIWEGICSGCNWAHARLWCLSPGYMNYQLKVQLLSMDNGWKHRFFYPFIFQIKKNLYIIFFFSLHL